MSNLRNYLVDYLSMRRALGYKMDKAERLLGQFVTFAEDRGENHVRTETALAWATHIATKSPQALRMGKATFRRQMACPLPEAYDLAARAMVENLLKADAREGIGAFLDKRAPTWHDFAP